ncbi:efflux RND transporter permease subunit [Brachyspira sp.]|uniref:efflux RND transporter permease subunit n=1 Tax=Brachyspira sp. TaxID=1977261 RepID=UPI003D7CED45
MKGFLELVVKRPVSVFMGMIAVLILGFVSLTKLSVDFLPDMELPYITVRTTYENAGPEEVEKSVTRIIENAVATVSGIKNITSTSKEGESTVFVEFNWKTDLANATADIREAIDSAKNSLPDDAESPTVLKFSTDTMPMMEIAFFGTDNLGALYNLVDNQILNKIEQASGVARAEIRGGLKTEMKVDIVLNRLHAYGLNINDIVSLLSSENQNLSGGETYEGVYKYTLRTMGEFTDEEDIENTVVALKTNDIPIKLREIGRVYQGYSDDTQIVKINGSPSVSVSVNKESGGNAVNVAKAVQNQLDGLTSILPEGVEYQILFNSADTVNESIRGVLDAAWQGGLFAIIVLMIYLWNIKTVSVIAISIPMSIIITFTLMYFMGITLNIISLSGLVLGIGMMVDNSIVVLENIFYYRNEGYGKYSSAINGTSSVALAITASTLTTIAVFLPFLFVEGQTGQLFKDLCITVTVSMIGSLFVALTIVPMLGARLITNKKIESLIPIEKFFNEKFHDKIKNIYTKILNYSIKNKLKVFIPSLSAAFIVIILGLIFIGKEGFPTTDEGQFKLDITMPVGTKSAQTQTFVTRMEKDIEIAMGEDFNRMQSRVESGSDENSAEIRVQLREKSEGRKKSLDEYMEIARNVLSSYPAQINISAVSTTVIGGGGNNNSGQSIKIELIGDDLDKSTEIANNIINAISEVNGIREPRLSRDDSNPELKIYVNREIAAKMGINVNTIANIVKTSFAGTTATTMTPSGSDVTDIDVKVQLGEPDRLNIDDINRLMIPTASGMTPISSIATVERSYGPTEIERKDSARITTITASGYGRALNEIIFDIQNKIKNEVFIPSGFSVNYSGDFEDMNEAFGQLLQALILALVLVYSIMASQFESFIAPFVIAFAVPFGFAGSLIALFLGRQTLNVYSAIGFIVLIGIVVNNGIVLIDYMNRLMAEKKISGDEAALESGARRLRPVLMTTLTTILGLLPMALASGSGNEMYQPLSLSILGGLIVSTAFTLIIVPTVYAAIRNKIPLKDYEKKDIESVSDFREYEI